MIFCWIVESFYFKLLIIGKVICVVMLQTIFSSSTIDSYVYYHFSLLSFKNEKKINYDHLVNNIFMIKGFFL
jgi:hypothetical protein